MIIGMFGLIIVALFANVWYYEYWYKKPIDKETSIVSGYRELVRIKNGRR